MKTTRKTLQTLMTAALLLGLSSVAHAQLTTFGSNNDGFDGFVGNSGDPFDVTQTLVPDAVRYTNSFNPGGLFTASLLKEYTLDRTPGSSYAFTGIMTLVQGVPDDNSRQGLILFADDDALITDTEGISAQINYDKDVNVQSLRPGVNGASSLAQVVYPGLVDTAWFGPELTFEVAVDFVGANIDIGFTLSDGVNTSLVSTSVLAADYTGSYFGFGSRTRVRGTVPGVNDINQIADYQSFDLSVVPEPSVVALLGAALGMFMVLRRRLNR